MTVDSDLTDVSLIDVSDDELAAEALAADPDLVLGDDAVPFDDHHTRFALLPEWYMPSPMLRTSRGRRIGLLMIAVALVVINIGGFCVTYGAPEFVWKWR